ncbi:MAG: hypothetical protein ACOC8F_08365 [Planctomycetota bacterium]
MQQPASSPSPRTGRLATACGVSAAVLIAAGLAAATVWLALAAEAHRLTGEDVFLAVALVLAGAAGGWVCVALGAVLRAQQKIGEAVAALGAIPTAEPCEDASCPDGASTEAPASAEASGASVSRAERTARDAERLQAVGEASRRAEDLMAAAQFDEARRVARDLAASYPDVPEAQRLVQRVRREARSFTIEQRRRLYQEADRMAELRRWRAAVAAGRRLLEQYPNSSEADAVAEKMDTLEVNARLEEARELRDRLRDMLSRRRYTEAVALAEDVLARFPETRIAGELREQMDRLRELSQVDPTK